MIKTGMESYDSYIRNDDTVISLELLILKRHMRNRQWVSAWVFEKD
jgi:hypothetical protein